MSINKYTREDGSIDLTQAYEDRYGHSNTAFEFLGEVERIQAIRSRQVAALAIAQARHLDKLTEEVRYGLR